MAIRTEGQAQALLKLMEEYRLNGANQSVVDQLELFIECARLHQERDEKYGAAWKKHGSLANLLRMSTKIERLLTMFWKNQAWQKIEEPDLDDAFDLINYTAFFLRQAMRDQWVSDGKS